MDVTLDWIDWRDWNDKLNEINKGEKARYAEACMYTIQPPASVKLANRIFDDRWNDTNLDRKYYFSVNVKETTGVKSIWGYRAFPKTQLRESWEKKGTYRLPSGINYSITEADFIPVYKITIRFTETETDGHIKDFWCGVTPDLLQSIFDYFNPDHEPGKYGSSDVADAKPKWTSLSKAEQEKRNATAVHKDRLGVVIEIGDHIAHPCGTYGGGSWVDIQEVTKITDNKVNGWLPERLIVVRTNNANKKLGW